MNEEPAEKPTALLSALAVPLCSTCSFTIRDIDRAKYIHHKACTDIEESSMLDTLNSTPNARSYKLLFLAAIHAYMGIIQTTKCTAPKKRHCMQIILTSAALYIHQQELHSHSPASSISSQRHWYDLQWHGRRHYCQCIHCGRTWWLGLRLERD